MRREIVAAAAAAGLVAIAGLAAYLLKRRRRPVAELPAGPPVVEDAIADEPMSRETRYDDEIDAEERRRHDAAERLRADPLNDRLENDSGS